MQLVHRVNDVRRALALKLGAVAVAPRDTNRVYAAKVCTLNIKLSVAHHKAIFVFALGNTCKM